METCPGEQATATTAPRKDTLPCENMALPVERQAPPWASDLLKYLQEHALPEDDLLDERVAH